MKEILVIVDAQNDFIDGSMGTGEAQAAVPEICERIRNFKDGLIITTMDTHGDNYFETKEGIALPVKHCIKNTKGWSINKDVANAIFMAATENRCKYDGVEKPTFGSVNLIKKIFEYVGGEDFKVTFLGFCTDICVISNVLLVKTLFHNTSDIYVDSECCAGVTPEKHEAALEVMKSCQINIIESHE